MIGRKKDQPTSGATPPRRSTHVSHPAVYAAVGASSSPDLLRFPPAGSTPFEEELRLGSGSDRFLTASSLLMTWGAPRGAGIDVVEIAHGDGGKYEGVDFDDAGVPRPASEPEVHFGPGGEPFVTAGTEVTFRLQGRRAPRRVRVVYTINEPRRCGYAWGTVDEDGAVGEQVLTVEHREDDTVHASARGFLWPADGSGIRGKSDVKLVIADARKQLSALAPGATRPANDLSGSEP